MYQEITREEEIKEILTYTWSICFICAFTKLCTVSLSDCSANAFTYDSQLKLSLASSSPKTIKQNVLTRDLIDRNLSRSATPGYLNGERTRDIWLMCYCVFWPSFSLPRIVARLWLIKLNHTSYKSLRVVRLTIIYLSISFSLTNLNKNLGSHENVHYIQTVIKIYIIQEASVKRRFVNTIYICDIVSLFFRQYSATHFHCIVLQYSHSFACRSSWFTLVETSLYPASLYSYPGTLVAPYVKSSFLKVTHSSNQDWLIAQFKTF